MVNNVNKGLLDALVMPNRSSNRNERAEDRNFDSFLAQNTSRGNSGRTDATRPRENNSRGSEGRGRNIETVSQTVVINGQVQTLEGDAAVDRDLTAVPVDEATENYEVALALQEDELLAEIAAILGITVQALTEILNALGMSPVDLQEGEAQTELLLLLHGLDDEVALLNLPAALPIMQEIAKTMEKYEPVLLEYSLQGRYDAQKAPQYVVQDIDEAVLTDPDSEPDAEIIPTVRAVQSNTEGASVTDLQVDVEATEVAATTAVTTETTTTTTTSEPLQSIEPIMAFTQATEQPVEGLARPVPIAAPVPQAPVNPQNVMEQIVQHMRFEVRGDIAEIRIQLKPDNLGEVSLRIATQNGIVVAQFVAESQRVKEIIESNFNQLRDALEQQGINISEIEVSVAQGEADRQFAFGADISSSRIRDIMEAAEGEAAEVDADVALEENLVDYLA